MNAFFSFSQCLRHAFFAGAGYGELERLSDADQKRWTDYDPPMVGSFKNMDGYIRADAPRHAKNLADWVEAALQCKSWNWDGDQFDAALHVLNDYRTSVGLEPFTIEQIYAIRERKP